MIPNPLKIFNPFDVPYGPLSINYIDSIEIDKKYYKSVSHYIYSSLVSTNYFKEILNAQTSIKDLKNDAEIFLDKEQKQIISKSIDNALFSQYTYNEILDILYKTGNKKLLYRNDDSYLGIGPDGNGQNIIGTKLEALRNIIKYRSMEMQKLKGEQEFFDKVYKVYLISKAFERIIESKKGDLEKYIGKSALDIFEELKETSNVIERLKIENLDYSTVIELFRKNNLESVTLELKYPGTLAQYYRSEYLGQYYDYMINSKKNYIFDQYTYDLAKQVFGEKIKLGNKDVILDSDNIRKQRDQELKKLSYDKKMELKDRLYKLYIENLLPNSDKIKANIDEEIGEVPENYIEMYRQIKDEINVLKVTSNKINLTIPIVQLPLVSEDNTPYYFDDTDILSPENTSFPFYVNGLFYPSICHYVNFCLLLTLDDINVQGAHILLLINEDLPSTDTSNYYVCKDLTEFTRKALKENRIRIIQNSLVKASNAKFKNRNLAGLLVSTSDVEIVYNDISDDYLGVGNDNGLNLVGEQLIRIRRQLIEEGVQPIIPKFKEIRFSEDLTKDPRLTDWYDNRLFDAIRSLGFLLEYKKSKYNISTISPVDVDYLLNNIYQNCQDILARNLANVNTPNEFIEKITSMKSPVLSQNSVDIIWQYMKNLLYNLDQISLKNRKGVFKNLVESQDKMKDIENFECKQIIPINNSYDKILNGVLNSVISIILSLKNMKNGEYKLEISDINFVKNLIDVKVDISKKEISISGFVHSYLNHLNIKIDDNSTLNELLNYCVTLSEKVPNKRLENRLIFFINLESLKEINILFETEKQKDIQKNISQTDKTKDADKKSEKEYKNKSEKYTVYKKRTKSVSNSKKKIEYNMKNDDEYVDDESKLLSLFDAIKINNKETVKNILKQDVNPNKTYPYQEGVTPLLYAIKYHKGDDLDILNLLLQYGSRIDDNSVQTSIEYPDILKIFLDKGINPNMLTEYDEPLINWASYKKQPQSVKLLLEYGANPNISDEDGNTPLLQVLMDGDYDTAKLLLQNGADPEIDNDGVNIRTLSEKNPEFLKYVNKMKNDDYKDIQLLSLFDAIKINDKKNVKNLLKQGVDSNKTYPYQEGVTPLLYAIKYNKGDDLDILNLLLQYGSNIDDNSVQASIEYPDILKIFLDKGINPNTLTEYDEPLINWASYKKQPQSIKLLLEYGANPNISDEDGNTPLLQVLMDGDYNTAKLLLQKGADPEIDNDGVNIFTLSEKNPEFLKYVNKMKK
jgi:ankyrin repeat protein/predicted NAD-dependent protein-ADP-ribosyltransferase YbiA (DUF1768 family)/uncharacterized ubiquitin-like protein YukD